MRNNKRKIILVILTIIGIIFMNISVYAHSGRTDANGGHRDNKNKSGLGSYHYHCGGYPAHLHTNGVCPYSSIPSAETKSATSNTLSSNKGSSSTTSSSSSSTLTNDQTVKNIQSEIEASSIRINEKIEEMKVGETKQLTASILPEDTENKNVTWKSSDESIVMTNLTGNITAKREGRVKVTVTTSNGKTDEIEINVIEDSNNVLKSSNMQNITDTNSESSNTIAGIITLGLVIGGGYLGYKKYKDKKSK